MICSQFRFCEYTSFNYIALVNFFALTPRFFVSNCLEREYIEIGIVAGPNFLLLLLHVVEEHLRTLSDTTNRDHPEKEQRGIKFTKADHQCPAHSWDAGVKSLNEHHLNISVMETLFFKKLSVKFYYTVLRTNLEPNPSLELEIPFQSITTISALQIGVQFR